jgi:hypothetical protein
MTEVLNGAMGPIQGGTLPQQKNKAWRYILSIALILVVVILSITAYFVHRENTLHSVCSEDAGASVLGEAGSAIYSNNLQELQKAVKVVQQEPHYQQDPNCLYIMVNYYIISSNSGVATHYLNEFEKTYNPSKGISSKFGIKPQSTQTLQAVIDNIEANQKQAKANIQVFPSEP